MVVAAAVTVPAVGLADLVAVAEGTTTSTPLVVLLLPQARATQAEAAWPTTVMQAAAVVAQVQ